jgi:hypothetical protein
MLKVLPVQSKEEQKNICDACGIPFDADLLAYAATVDGELVGACQFEIKADGGKIHNIASAKGKDDFEAMFIMGRGTLNFIDLCGVHKAYCLDENVDKGLAKAIGFTPNSDGVLEMDLTHFFEHPCSHKH